MPSVLPEPTVALASLTQICPPNRLKLTFAAWDELASANRKQIPYAASDTRKQKDQIVSAFRKAAITMPAKDGHMAVVFGLRGTWNSEIFCEPYPGATQTHGGIASAARARQTSMLTQGRGGGGSAFLP